METLDLFASDVETNLEENHAVSPIAIHRAEPADERAMRRISAVLRAGHPVCIATSTGKDSSVLSSLALLTARKLKEAGQEVPPMMFVSSDTGVEHPQIARQIRADHERIRNYAKKHGLNVRTLITRPRIADTFAVRIIGGRALPSFPDGNADCSTLWKVEPNTKALRKARVELRENDRWQEPVVMTGVRSGESVARDQRISTRQETAEGMWRNEEGMLRCSPILDFTVDDVWEHIGYCNAGVISSFSDFANTMELYRAGGGSSCVVVADMKGQTNKKPCSSRFGCWSCQKVKIDHSMQQMLDYDEKYAYMRPLARLRNFMQRTQYDWSRRHYVKRTIDADGYIEIAADAYSPEMLKELLIYTLTAQALSGVAIISEQELVAIDAAWSRSALWPPFTALKIYFEVCNGMLIEAPEIQEFPKAPVPKIGKMYVGASWREALGPNCVAGLRDTGREMFSESCGPGLRELKNGTLVIDCETDDGSYINEEGAADFITFWAE